MQIGDSGKSVRSDILKLDQDISDIKKIEIEDSKNYIFKNRHFIKH